MNLNTLKEVTRAHLPSLEERIRRERREDQERKRKGSGEKEERIRRERDGK